MSPKSVPAAKSSSDEATASAAQPEAGLSCQKCAQPTTLKDSLPTGRNALRRNCLECVSTDKWLTRAIKKPAGDKPESEEQKERRTSAENVKATLVKMSPAEKAKWYTQKKEERRQQERGTKRTFSTGVGFVQEEEKTSWGEKEQDQFETCEMWCARQMSLKRYQSYEEAETAFKAECKKVGSRTMQKRGETLLCSFQGVLVASGKEHSLTSGVRQRADIVDEADLQDFKDEAASKKTKAQWRLESDKQAFLEGTLEAPASLLNVAQDIAKQRVIDAEVEQQWMETMEATATKKREEKKEPTVTIKSVGVESMGLEATIQRGVQSMNDGVARQKALAAQAAEETSHLGTELLRAEGSEFQARCEDLLPKVLADIEEKKAEWETSLKNGVAQKDAAFIHNQIAEVAKQLKDWMSQSQPLKDYKDEIKSWKGFLAKCKQQEKKKDKAATKANSSAMSSNKLASGSSWHNLTLCKQALDALQVTPALEKDYGVFWNLEKDLLDAKAEAEVGPVVFSEGQAQSLCDEMTNNEYYKFQKVWVSEQMKKVGSGAFLSAQVTKAAVSKKMTGLWSKLANAGALSHVKTSENLVKEMFVPQFFQQAKGCQVSLHTDFALPDCRLQLEGKSFLAGVPLDKVPGKDLHDKRGWLMNATWEQFSALKTWSVSMVPGKGVVIPGDHCFLCATLDDSHGGRVHMLMDGHAQRTLEVCHKQVQDNAALQGLKTGKLLEALQLQLKAPTDAENLALTEAAAQPPLKRLKSTPALGSAGSGSTA